MPGEFRDGYFTPGALLGKAMDGGLEAGRGADGDLGIGCTAGGARRRCSTKAERRRRASPATALPSCRRPVAGAARRCFRLAAEVHDVPGATSMRPLNWASFALISFIAWLKPVRGGPSRCCSMSDASAGASSAPPLAWPGQGEAQADLDTSSRPPNAGLESLTARRFGALCWHLTASPGARSAGAGGG